MGKPGHFHSGITLIDDLMIRRKIIWQDGHLVRMNEKVKMVRQEAVTQEVTVRYNVFPDFLQEERIILKLIKELHTVVTTIIKVVHLVGVKLHVKMFSMVKKK